MVDIKIFVNEKATHVQEMETLFSIRQKFKDEADVIILNGFQITSDSHVKENDRITLIKKGERPSLEELEGLIAARHTPLVFDKLKKSTVGIAGLGGLGSNVAVSLARVGVGRLLLVDFDVVEPSNLNRQQYWIRHIGMKKTEALKEVLTEINPFIKLETKEIYLSKYNVDKVFKDVDIIVEALDNPESKAEIITAALKEFKDKVIIGASGMAGYFSNNTIVTKKVNDRFYLVGDGHSEAKEGCGLMAPRVAIAANHQANTAIRVLLGEKEV